jgi:predicted ferric reductase
LRTVGDTTEIVISKSEPGAHSFSSLQPGQFVFVNVPEISLFEWHPFTVSSSPTEAEMTLHVKRMARFEWSGRLYSLAKYYDTSTNVMLPPRVCIDGPYGVPLQYQKYKSVVLIAGGIGITPVISIFRYLYDRARVTTEDIPELVQLVWVVKRRSDLALFLQTLHQGIRDNMGRRFMISLHATREKQYTEDFADPSAASSSVAELPCAPGRPDIHKILTLARPPQGDGLVFVCGPDSLVSTCAVEAANLGFHFHSETFEL